MMTEIQKAIMDERERCAAIAEKRHLEDRNRYIGEKDWSLPYAYNRVIRASMDIASQIRAQRIP